MDFNHKSKKEQIFVLLLICIGIFGVLCLTGCGKKKSCETIKCGSEAYEGGRAIGISIPGCGGCLTPEEGCNTSCWAQSCKISTAYYESIENTDTYTYGSEKKEDKKKTDTNCIIGCNTEYYDRGCMGCGQQQKNSYNGCFKFEEGVGCFYGSTDSDEKMIFCGDGCGGCISSIDMGAEIINELEHIEGIQ